MVVITILQQTLNIQKCRYYKKIKVVLLTSQFRKLFNILKQKLYILQHIFSVY